MKYNKVMTSPLVPFSSIQIDSTNHFYSFFLIRVTCNQGIFYLQKGPPPPSRTSNFSFCCIQTTLEVYLKLNERDKGQQWLVIN